MQSLISKVWTVAGYLISTSILKGSIFVLYIMQMLLLLLSH